MLIAAVGIYFDEPILIVGAMVVGPDFGPIAGICVALVNRNAKLVRRSANALLIGFPLGIARDLRRDAVAHVGSGRCPRSIDFDAQTLTRFISNPNFFSVYVGLLAGAVGMLSLTTAKSSALVGVLISVATIPAAANIGVAAAYGDWATVGGAPLQLVLNLIAIFAAGLVTLLRPAADLHAATKAPPERIVAKAGRPPAGDEQARGLRDPDDEPEAT